MPSPRIEEDDPRARWTRNTNNGGGQVTVPEACWPILELMRAQILPDGMDGCLQIHVMHRATKTTYVTKVRYADVDDVQEWSEALLALLETMAEDAE